MDIGALTPFSSVTSSSIYGQAFKNGSDVDSETFSSHLAAVGENFVAKLETAEAVSIRGIKGEVSAFEVASAVMDAEQSIRMASSIRDKIVNAYLEISRMQI